MDIEQQFTDFMRRLELKSEQVKECQNVLVEILVLNKDVLYISLCLEVWLSRTDGEGVHLAGYVVKLLLYANDLILISKTTHGLREHLKALEHFCQEVGMQVNITKTKIMIFSLNKKDKPITFLFEGSPSIGDSARIQISWD
jgi:hypothetical protein